MNVVIVQARSNSSRYPNKVLKKINNLYLIEIILKRLKKSTLLDKIVLAIPNTKQNNKLENIIKNLFKDIIIIRGSEKNLISRFIKASKSFPLSTNLIRITGDCPFVDYKLLDKMLIKFQDSNYDYMSNTLKPTFPDGLDIEIFKKNLLLKISNKNLSKFDKEHVTPYMKNNKFIKKYNYISKINYSNIRLTVDFEEDYIFINRLFKYFKYDIYCDYKKIINLFKLKPNFFKKNNLMKRNIGSSINTGQKIWGRAKKVIPGGNMLFSKRPEMFLPEGWPVYFNKTSGCKIIDLDNNTYYDFCSMGVGTNILGYSNKELDKSIHQVIKSGNMSTLNSADEVLLAEKLISMHSWSDMVKFARTGADANSMAIRIARAYTGKDKIAVCGYHGWHDWYLSGFNNSKYSNYKNKIKTAGVAKKLHKSTIFFDYNDLEGLKKILSKKDVGAIIMEVERDTKPKNNFLKNVKKLCKKYSTLLIFDECTSGFREVFGGHHLKYSVYPDIAVFGKALGNGYAITAVLGRKDVMNTAQDTFISSTFNTERIGPVAALKTLEIMERTQSWKKICKIGEQIRSEWVYLSKKNNLNINITGLKSNFKFTIDSKNWIKYKTFITQEMLKKGFLATNTIFTSIEHSDKLINKYLKHLDKIFKKINHFEDGVDVNSYLNFPICHTDFKRLT